MNEWLQALFDESPLAIGFSRDGLMLDANAAYVDLFGYPSLEALRGRSILEQIAPSHRAQIVEIVAMRAAGQSLPHRYETRGLRMDGTEFPFEITTTRVVLDDGPLTVAFISDLSEREQVLGALRASEERFRTLSSAALEGIFVHADGKIVIANEAGAAMYGFDPVSIIGVSIRDLTAPDYRAVVEERIRAGSSDAYQGVAMRRDGSTFMAEVRGRSLFHQGRPMRVSIIRDITEKERVEAEQHALAERVRHAQKLESLGILAGGVAHDFNNILTVITNAVALARRGGASATTHLDTISVAAERAADLCRQMLAYAGKTALAREPVDVSALVAEMSAMLEVSVAKKATIARELAPDLPPIVGDATQIRQVLMNLVLNAAEAIAAAHRGGAVAVTTGVGSYDAETLARSAAGGNPKPGRYVWIEVRDDGVGMDEPTLAQMFDPFFTTKFTGRGLGMATVLGIVRAHSGAIEVGSKPDTGTRIRVLFPAAERVSSKPRAVPAPSALRGRAVVLIVDDEENVRISSQLLLEGLGFEVLAAPDGHEAVEVFRRESGRIDVVLLDLTMPGMDGVATLEALRRIAADVPIVLTTGYGALRPEEWPSSSGPPPEAVLAKPCGEQVLLATLLRTMRSHAGKG